MNSVKPYSKVLAGLMLLMGFWPWARGYDLIRNSSGQPIQWNAGAITMQLRLGSSPTLTDGSNYNSSVQAAMQQWNGFMGSVQFNPVVSSGGAGDGNGSNEIVFSGDIFGEAFDSTTLAVTTTWLSGSRRMEADILFNTAWAWDSYGGSLSGHAGEDIRRVAIHELGHALGLDHPDQAGQSVTAIMNSTVSNVDTLQADDIAGAQFLYGGSGGVTPPGNDAFANASTISLSGNSGQATGTSRFATKESGEPDHAGYGGGASVWWKWTAPGGGSMAITTAGSSFDTLLGVYTGSSVSGLSTVASNDDANSGTRTSSVTFNVSGGTTYYIAVDGWESDSGSVTLNLNFTPTAADVAPSITSHPSNQSVTPGQTAQFSVSVTGTPVPTYQWQRLPAGGSWGNVSNGGNYSGAQTATLTITGTTAAMNGDQFRCVASNSAGAATSNAATLSVTSGPPPVITGHPFPQSPSAGGGANFAVGVSGTGTLSYRWQVLPAGGGAWIDLSDGGGYSGATNQMLSLTNVSSALSGNMYRCVVTNGGGSATSNGALLRVIYGNAPRVTVSTYLTIISSGSSSAQPPRGDAYLSLQPAVTGVGPITYQWYKDGVALSGFGANTASYFKNPATQADAGNYVLMASNSAGVAVSAEMKVVWNSTGDAQPWLDTFRQGSMVYFLAGSPGRIMRYDLAQETWLPLVVLGGSQAVTAFLPTPAGVFIAYGNIVTRRTLDLQTEVPVVTAPGTVNSMFARGGRVYFEASGTVYSYDQSTLAAGPSFSPPSPWLSSGGLSRRARPVISATNGFGITTRPSASPNDIIRIVFASDGSISDGVDSIYHANFSIGYRQYLSPDESLVVDNSGVIYRTDDLNYAGSLGLSFDDLAFQGDGSLVVLRGRTLSRLAPGSYVETGRFALPATAQGVFANAGYIYAFSPPANTVSNPGVTKVTSGDFAIAPLPAPISPVGARMSIDEVFLDGQTIHILSHSQRGVVRWDTQSRQFLSTLPVRGNPFFSSYAKGTNRYSLIYSDGTLTEIRLAVDATERQFTNYSVHNRLFGFVTMDDLVVLNLTNSGSGGDARLVYDRQGAVRFWSNGATYNPSAHSWQPVTRRLYSGPSNNGGSTYETVPSNGVLPGPDWSTNQNAVGPFRINDAGTRLLAMNGYVLDGSLATYAQLTNPVIDGAWASNAVYTIRNIGSGTQVQKWDGLTFVAAGTRTIPGEAVRVFCPNDNVIVVLTTLDGYLRFTLLDANLALTAIVDNGPPATLTITTHPQNQSVQGGVNATFSLAVTASQTPTYQWQRLPAAGGAWSDLSEGGAYSGTASAALTVTSATLAMNGDQFRCLVANAAGTFTSNVANLTVTRAGGDFNGDGAADSGWSNPSTGQRSVWFMDGTGFSGGVDLGAANPAVQIATTGDFNGDGQPDFVMQNKVTGERSLWLMNGTTQGSTVVLTTQVLDWQIVFTGDINSDGKTDLVWQNMDTGQALVWIMNGSTRTSVVDLGITDPGLQVVGAADFNADGKPDFLVQHRRTGDRAIWLMNGTTRTGTLSLGTQTLDWELGPAADFNGDGKPDLIWQNTQTGLRMVWIMNGGTLVSAISLGTFPTTWKIVSATDLNGDGKPDLVWQDKSVPAVDFNGDGKTDLIWHNSQTGQVVLWFMNDMTQLGTADLGTQALQWQIMGAADFNGDGKGDLLWRNQTTGLGVIWLMNGDNLSSVVDLGVQALEWQIGGAADFNGDGQVDLLWQNTRTGQRSLWYMNGPNLGSASDLGFQSLSWQICGAGDFNGDGLAEIIWQNTQTGQRTLWFMNGRQLGSAVDLGIEDVAWQIAGAADMDGDGQADILLQNTQTGQRKVWVMHGYNRAGTLTLPTVPAAWSIAN